MAGSSERRGFTPGPWTVEAEDYGVGLMWTVHRPWLGLQPFSLEDRENGQADAHLIAAAPDLYEALRQAVDYSAQAHEPDEPWWMREARAALRKAEGRDTGGDDE